MVGLVGILNVTPDSFSDGGEYFDYERAISHAEQLFTDGADLVDIGGESTRPHAVALTWQEEWARLEPILPSLLAKYPGKISLDSYHPETIRQALTYGPVIVNDITGLRNQAMIDIISEHDLTCIASHLPMSAADSRSAHSSVLLDNKNTIIDDMNGTYQRLRSAGIKPENIILDPGIGFGKTPKLNHELISIARDLPGKNIMIGYSRKRFLGENRFDIAINLAAAELAIASGASYLRVHDVKAHYDCINQIANRASASS